MSEGLGFFSTDTRAGFIQRRKVSPVKSQPCDSCACRAASAGVGLVPHAMWQESDGAGTRRRASSDGQRLPRFAARRSFHGE